MAEKAQEDLEEKKEEQIIEKKKQDSQVEAAKRMLQMKKEHWYALYVQVQHEKKIRDAINQHGEALLAGKVLDYQIKAWVATRKLKRKWSDRVVVCEEVCAPGIVFVNLRMIDKLHIYIDKHIKAFVFDRVSRKAAVIPDDIMNEFVDHYLDDPTLNVSMETPVVGKKVKVLVGPLEGRVGYLVEQKGSHRLLIKVAEFTFSIEVKVQDVVVVDDKEESERVDRYSGISKPRAGKKASVRMMTMEQFEEKNIKEANDRYRRQVQKQKRNESNP